MPIHKKFNYNDWKIKTRYVTASPKVTNVKREFYKLQQNIWKEKIKPQFPPKFTM